MQTHPDRAADLMRGTAGPVLSLRRLANLLGAPSARLAAELDHDPRFRVVRSASALDRAAVWTEGLGPAYTAVLEAAGMTPSCTIVLVDRAGHDDSVAALLARTLGCLLDLPAGPTTALGDSRVIDALAALAPLMPGAGTSTTLPPPARPPTPAPPRRRPPSGRPPHAPGPRRG